MILIEPLKEEELPAVQALEQLCFPDPWSLKGLRGTFREEHACFLTAKNEDGVLCGYLNTTWVLDELNVNRICVHPAFRRLGVAKQLFAAVRDFCRPRGVTRFFLEVREGNLPARALYAREGFTEVGIRPNFYENPTEGAVLMTCEPSALD